MWVFVQIVNSYKTNKKLEQMLQNLDVYVTPVLNMDGYIFSWANDSVSAAQVLLFVITFQFIQFIGSSVLWLVPILCSCCDRIMTTLGQRCDYTHFISLTLHNLSKYYLTSVSVCCFHVDSSVEEVSFDPSCRQQLLRCRSQQKF